MLIGDKLDEMNLLKRLDENILKYYGAYIRGSKSFHYWTKKWDIGFYCEVILYRHNKIIVWWL